MTVAAQQRIMSIVKDLPDEAEGPVINFMVSFTQPKQSARTEEFEMLMDKAQAWAKEAGLTPDDITDAIKTVRRRKLET